MAHDAFCSCAGKKQGAGVNVTHAHMAARRGAPYARSVSDFLAVRAASVAIGDAWLSLVRTRNKRSRAVAPRSRVERRRAAVVPSRPESSGSR